MNVEHQTVLSVQTLDLALRHTATYQIILVPTQVPEQVSQSAVEGDLGVKSAQTPGVQAHFKDVSKSDVGD